ncbi:MAG: ABC transporter ATP-binding protein [Desulfobacterales bacterium]|nr:ABC transporter ATP-binding protein [Desulfobacterales bacterium]
MTENSNTEQLITGKGISKNFNTNGSCIEVLKDINFGINAGETIAVVGASGIGKSTFLHILGTLDRPDSGHLFFRGEDVFLLDDNRLAKLRNEFVGFVFQFHHLLKEFSSLENVMMPVLIGGQSRACAVEAAEEILVRVGLKDRLHHRVGDLSGGEQQRVALSRALSLKPALLLADEPTGNLDRKNSEQIHDLLLELNNELAMTMVVVTHNTELAAIMSRRVTIIDWQLVDTS